MISRHTEIAILNEDKGWSMRQILGKSVVGNKRCVPNQIELRKHRHLHWRFLKNIGLVKEYQSSKFCIDEYLTLPNIKIIGLIRSGNDVISSQLNRSEKSLRAASYRWCRAIEVIHELKKNYEDTVLVVSFESLVTQPKTNMERVAAFLKVEYQERMLEGPQYNPWYPEAGMNIDKVNRAQKTAVDFKLPARFPATHRQYEELLQSANIAVTIPRERAAYV
jgi:hypothetical protein